MTHVILQPAGDPYARQHYADTIERPVPQDRLRRFLSPAEMGAIEELYGGRAVPTWGVTPGEGEVNRKKWERIDRDDVALVARSGEIFASARVTLRTRNRELALDLWGVDDDGDAWEYLFFLDDVQPQTIRYDEFNAAAGYRPAARIQGFNVLPEDRSDTLLEALGLDRSEPRAIDATTYVLSLVGQTIYTISRHAPNRVLRMEDGAVLVGTQRSPAGEPVPLADVQSALSQLFTDGEVVVGVDTLESNRSSFIGAVLASLPGTETDQRSGRVRLVQGWRVPGPAAPSDIAEAVSLVDQIAAPRRERGQGRRQTAAERRALEERAVNVAIQHYEGGDWDVRDVGSRASYDLECRKDGRVLHVEVKGTTSLGSKVLLTRNEVRHARGSLAEKALFVLADIELRRDESGISVTGGREIRIEPWDISEGSLEPVGFEYSLPSEGSAWQV
jgi:hypothetical protein